MPRISRAVAVGFPHHITQRGNYRRGVFEKENDYLRYIEWLMTYTRKYSLKIKGLLTPLSQTIALWLDRWQTGLPILMKRKIAG